MSAVLRLTRKFTNNRIAPEYDGLVIYAKDAMNGLDLANKLMNPEQKQLLIEELRAAQSSDVQGAGRSRRFHEIRDSYAF